jgi:hypothetical protein
MMPMMANDGPMTAGDGCPSLAQGDNFEPSGAARLTNLVGNR